MTSRNTRICFWVNDSEKQRIQKMAKSQHLNLSEYLRLVSQGHLEANFEQSEINLSPILEQIQQIRAEIASLGQREENRSNPFDSQIIDSLLQFWMKNKTKRTYTFEELEDLIEYEFQRDYVLDTIIELGNRNLAQINEQKELIRWKN